MRTQVHRFHLKSRTIALSLVIALMLMMAVSGGVAAHPGHDHANDEPASWTARIDEVMAGGAALLLAGGVFWMSNRRSDQSEVDDQADMPHPAGRSATGPGDIRD